MAPETGTITADPLVAYLDVAEIRRALVLSVAYQFGNPNRPAVKDEYAKVRAENDWTSEQVARFLSGCAACVDSTRSVVMPSRN